MNADESAGAAIFARTGLPRQPAAATHHFLPAQPACRAFFRPIS